MTPQQHADAIVEPSEPSKPHALFAFNQDDFDGGILPMYTIVGGPADGSTVSAATLREMGIEVPR